MSGRGGRRRYQGNRQGASDGMAVDQAGGASNGNGTKVPFVEIRNWEASNMMDVVNFLERKSRIRLQNPRQNGNVLTAQIAPNETREMEKWSGIRFAGAKLNIKIVHKPSEPSADTSATINMLTGILQSRYHPAAKLLNLSGLMSDPTLIQHGLLANPSTALKVFKALLRVASDNLDDVESVSLEGNFLTNVDLAEQVANVYPKLQNLSLANNQIGGVAAFTRLRNKFPLLRELVLGGNPLQQNPAFQSQVNELIAMFPRLIILDGITVRNEAELPKNALPAPIKPTFFEDEGVASMTPLFLTNFFSVWDTDRSALLTLYDQASFFSVCLDSSAPHLPTSKQTPQSYVQMSRNLMRNHGLQARHHRIYFGPAQVASAFNKVPPSRHDLSNAQAFAIDSWKISDVRSPGDTAIMMVVHGEFEETTNSKITNNSQAQTLRSFDRTLVVLPGPNMSYIVASDMLTIRLHSTLPLSATPAGSAQMTPGAADTSKLASPATMPPAQGGQIQGIPQAQAAPATAPLPPQQPQQPMNPPTNNIATPTPAPQENVILQEFMRQTGLVAEYAEMCLKQANYDPNVAMQLFQQSRAQLPPNAFLGH